MARLAEAILVINLSNGLIGLSMLSGNNGFLGLASGAEVETHAVRVAKAAFTAPPTTPPWKEAAPKTPVSSQISAIKRMTSVIDKAVNAKIGKLPDIQTAFTTYKALDRLKLLAESAAKPTTSAAERKALQQVFAKGLADLQSFLGTAPTDKVGLTFAQPTRRAQSVGITPETALSKTVGTGLLDARDTPIPGLAGNEVLRIDLSKSNASDSVTVDLAQTPQPPTLDSVANAINAAIASVPMLDTNGNPVLDANGNAMPRWMSRMSVDKSSGKWGLTLDAPGVEKVAIDQVGAKDALMVVRGQTPLDAPASAQILRFDDPAAAFTRKTLGTISAVDRVATEQAKLTAPTTSTIKDGPKPAEPRIWAATDARAIATDAEGFSYVVGTTAGDLGANRSDGGNDLFLTKLDSEGKVIWQRTMGVAGEAEGAAISIAANGDIVVAGTVKGPFGGAAGADSDMLVARFDTNGDEKFATALRTLGDDSASAVTIGTDGSLYVGGKSSTGAGDAFVARLDATGKLQERRTIDSGGSDGVTALAIGGAGELLALTRESGVARLRRIDAQALSGDLGALDLGSADARAIAVSATGEIAVAGSTYGALAGGQVNAVSGGRDGFVTRIDSALASASTSYIGSADDDQVDSVAFMGGSLYVGGRTTGALDGARRGAVDGFISRIDTATGAIAGTTQFGQAALRTEPVRIAAARGGAGIMGKLGLRRGTVNAQDSTRLVAQTSLRAGDEFSIRMQGGAIRKITIADDDTLTTLSDKIRKITGKDAKVTMPKLDGKSTLQIEAREGHSIELIAGAVGKDALAKLGLEPARLVVPTIAGPKDPKVRPGGNFGLGLTEVLNLGSAKDAAVALDRVKAALSTTQTAYRSLYWDSAKAATVNGTVTSGGSAYQKAQLAQYQAALDRLAGPAG